MSAHGDFVGRLAQLCNIKSRPELNEAHVLIQAYLPGKDRFSVRTLPSPIARDAAVVIAVRLSSLALCSPGKYPDKYTSAQEVQVDSIEKAVRDQPEGVTLKWKSTQYSKDLLVVRKSHRIVGEKVALNDAGFPEPMTKHIGNVHIGPSNNDAVIEIEDIHFIGSAHSRQSHLFCMKGSATTFRRCVFNNIAIVVAGNASALPLQRSAKTEQGRRVSEMIGIPNVVFESCVIDGGMLTTESTGVWAGSDGTVTLLNCVIRNYGAGVATIAGSRIIMKHCKIEGCMVGLSAEKMTKSVELFNCTVLADPHTNEYGILVNAAGPAVIRGCRVENFKDIGIYLRGSKHVSRVAISDCHVAGCHAGVHIELAIGKIAVNQCSFVKNKSYNIRNFSAVEGVLTVDGVVQEAVKTGRYQIPTELVARRCGQRAGICDINCLHCGRKEEPGEKLDGFKKVLRRSMTYAKY
eukprot:gene8681-10275_t